MNFESTVIRELCNMAGIKKSRTTPYHPAGNGQCERFNSTLLGMLGTLNDEQKVNWKNYVLLWYMRITLLGMRVRITVHIF